MGEGRWDSQEEGCWWQLRLPFAMLHLQTRPVPEVLQTGDASLPKRCDQDRFQCRIKGAQGRSVFHQVHTCGGKGSSESDGWELKYQHLATLEHWSPGEEMT